MLEFQKAGSEVFDNGNLIRTQAKQGGVENAFDIKIFTEAYLRPLFARAIGPFRWMALSGDPADIAATDRAEFTICNAFLLLRDLSKRSISPGEYLTSLPSCCSLPEG